MRLFSSRLFIGLIAVNCTLHDICTPGYTATIRPPTSYTTKLKLTQMQALHLPGDPSQYEEDHIISLELCGDPKDPRNLTPERWDRARRKDVLETQFHRAVCRGEMTLESAQRQIITYE